MTMVDVERGLLARYAARVLSRPELPVRAARHVLWWLSERNDSMGFGLPQPLVEILTQQYGAALRFSEFEQVFLKHRDELVSALDRAAKESQRPEPLAANVETLINALAVPNADAAWKIVGLVACCARFDQIQYFANTVLEVASPLPRAIALMVGEPLRVVEECLAVGGELLSAGLLQIRDGDQVGGYNARYAVPARINSCLDRGFASFAEMRNRLLGDPLASNVGLDDYEHVSADRDLVTAVLKGGAQAQAAGVNILLYGPPGSGKTELAKVAAKAAGLVLYATGEETHHGGEADRASRLTDLVFSNRLLQGENAIALLFDEMEDVAVHLIRRGGSKVYLNRLLETNPVPIVWTSNELGNIDPALLRRMTLAVELKRPPAAQRARIMEQMLKRHELAISDHEIARLSQSIDATPAIIENAIRAAKLAGGSADTIERVARGIMRAVTGVGARRAVVIPAFDPELTTASRDLIELADQLVGGQARAFSLCLYGPPGTGKSAYARYLAGRLGLQVLQIRASDILGMYVGQSEKNIAAAFEEARETGTMLVFDEADSLLWDRRDAQRAWEASQVNEMLTWMEEHPLPVVFTTNLMDRIDQASLRRFTFAVRFDYLSRAALQRAWRVFFGMESPPAEGLAYTNLAPGDFAKARKQAEMLGILGKPTALVELLADISRGKPGASASIGF